MSKPIKVSTGKFVAIAIEGEITESRVCESEEEAIRDLASNIEDSSVAVMVVQMFSVGWVQRVEAHQYGSVDEFLERVENG